MNLLRGPVYRKEPFHLIPCRACGDTSILTVSHRQSMGNGVLRGSYAAGLSRAGGWFPGIAVSIMEAVCGREIPWMVMA